MTGAFGSSGKNAGLIRESIRKTGAEIELGGGIRSVGNAGRWLETGVARVIISTLATQDPGCILTPADEWGSDRVIAGVDAKGGKIAVEGWQETAGNFLGWAQRFEEMCAGFLLYTNVDVEGRQKGVRFEPVRQLIAHVKIPVIVVGGISARSDVAGLKEAGASVVPPWAHFDHSSGQKAVLNCQMFPVKWIPPYISETICPNNVRWFRERGRHNPGGRGISGRSRSGKRWWFCNIITRGGSSPGKNSLCLARWSARFLTWVIDIILVLLFLNIVRGMVESLLLVEPLWDCRHWDLFSVGFQIFFFSSCTGTGP